ncbi:MAG: sulfurtransferase-like selenium metabolism protein YedF [Oscillibacter sp.]
MRKILLHLEGEPCPAPVVKAAHALEELREPGVVEIYVDNAVAVQNLTRMAGGRGLSIQTEQTGENAFRVTIDVPTPLSTQPLQEETCAPQAKNGLLVAVEADTMGRGDETLGRTLLKGFLFALSRLPQPPATLLFYNGGAKLTTTGSTSLEDLRELAARGTEIFTCGTCLNHYGLADRLEVGEVTNMYDIVERLTAAEQVVKP